MISRLKLGLTVVCMVLGVSAMGAEHKELKAFPEAKEGMERFVIVLPHKDRSEEGNFAVELIAGQTMMTDGVNQMRMGLKIESRSLKGWGYTFYEVTGKPITSSTIIAPLPGQPKVRKFVAGTPLQIPYNSRLPVVVYAPKGTEIRYRIWEAPPEMKEVAATPSGMKPLSKASQTLSEASQTIDVDGKTLALHVEGVSNKMPTTDPAPGSRVYFVIRLSTKDRSALPDGLTIHSVFGIHGEKKWETRDFDGPRRGAPSMIEIVARNAPAWTANSKIDVVVKLQDSAKKEHLIRAEGVSTMVVH